MSSTIKISDSILDLTQSAVCSSTLNRYQNQTIAIHLSSICQKLVLSNKSNVLICDFLNDFTQKLFSISLKPIFVLEIFLLPAKIQKTQDNYESGLSDEFVFMSAVQVEYLIHYFRSKNIEYMIAPSDSMAQCVHLERTSAVHAILTNHINDAILFCGRKILFNVNIDDMTCSEYDYNKLSSIYPNISIQKLRNVCISFGCSYGCQLFRYDVSIARSLLMNGNLNSPILLKNALVSLQSCSSLSTEEKIKSFEMYNNTLRYYRHQIIYDPATTSQKYFHPPTTNVDISLLGSIKNQNESQLQAVFIKTKVRNTIEESDKDTFMSDTGICVGLLQFERIIRTTYIPQAIAEKPTSSKAVVCRKTTKKHRHQKSKKKTKSKAYLKYGSSYNFTTDSDFISQPLKRKRVDKVNFVDSSDSD